MQKGDRRWRVVSYGTAPFLVVLGVLLLRTGNSFGAIAGSLIVLLAALGIAVPLLMRHQR